MRNVNFSLRYPGSYDFYCVLSLSVGVLLGKNRYLYASHIKSLNNGLDMNTVTIIRQQSGSRLWTCTPPGTVD
jgi:hypothetical protein